jgi:hypothetical protein
MTRVIQWGLLAGLVHFAAIAFLYANPLTDRLSRGLEQGPAVRQWASKPKYFGTQFLGTQVEIFILTVGFLWLRPLIAVAGQAGAAMLGALLAATRVYPRFWNMWTQTTYPRRLLAIEVVNGTIGTLVVVVFLEAVGAR